MRNTDRVRETLVDSGSFMVLVAFPCQLWLEQKCDVIGMFQNISKPTQLVTGVDPVAACFTIEDYLEVAISYSVIVCWGSIAPVTRLGSEHLL